MRIPSKNAYESKLSMRFLFGIFAKPNCYENHGLYDPASLKYNSMQRNNQIGFFNKPPAFFYKNL